MWSVMLLRHLFLWAFDTTARITLVWLCAQISLLVLDRGTLNSVFLLIRRTRTGSYGNRRQSDPNHGKFRGGDPPFSLRFQWEKTMKVKSAAFLFLVLFIPAGFVQAQALPPSATSGTLIFDDEFNGSAIDTNAWTVINRHGEYSQDEDECNIPQEVNVANGTLVITTAAGNATCGDFNPDGTVWHTPAVAPYVSGDIQWTNFNFTYGTVEIRAAFPPQADGLWPATWLLGANCQATNPMTGETGVGTCPAISTTGYTETDMTECFAGRWCGFGVFNPGQIGGCFVSYPLNDSNMHIYDTVWTPTEIDQYMDGTQVAACSQSMANPMFLIIQTQTATGMGVPSNLPADFDVDYVRVYANQYTTSSGGTAPPPPPPPPALSISPANFPNGTVGAAYSGSVSATGGTPPYTFVATSLVANLVMNTSGTAGILTGTPTVAGTDVGTVTVTDSAQAVAGETYSFVISAAPPLPAPPPPTPAPFSFTGGTLPDGTIGSAYSFQMVATGGTPPYRWLVQQGSLPPGLSLSSSGLLSGTPTGYAIGTASGVADPFYVHCRDSAGNVARNVPFFITITSSPDTPTPAPAPTPTPAPTSGALAITVTALPNATLGAAYTPSQLIATGGTPPYKWLVQQGSLPPGMSLSSSGVLSGTPTDYAVGGGSGIAIPFYVYCADSAGSAPVQNVQFYLTVN
jgi:beta-glucanase (GH16 family)